MPSFLFERGAPAPLVYKGQKGMLPTMDRASFESFGSQLLGLGDVTAAGQYVEAVAAVFDLEGFTAFSNQTEFNLVMPEFLAPFLNWLFSAFKREVCAEVQGDRVLVLLPLPFFVKFLGDGILVLWSTERLQMQEQGNIVVAAHNIVEAYAKEFVPGICEDVSNPPKKLRCGIARGRVLSIGNGQDFVGPCINIAARLQKLPGLTFAASRRGFNFKKYGAKIEPLLIVKKVELRGIGKSELIYVLKSEFEKLGGDREFFRDVHDDAADGAAAT